MNRTSSFFTIFVFLLNRSLTLSEWSGWLLFYIQFLNVWGSRFILLNFSNRILFYWSDWGYGSWYYFGLWFFLWRSSLLLNRCLLNWCLSWRWTNWWSRLLCCSFRWKCTPHLLRMRSHRRNLSFTLSYLFHFSWLIL